MAEMQLDVAKILEWVRQHNVRPLVLSVTGSHVWGLDTPESDLDIRGIYVSPTRKVLSLHPGKDTIEGLNQIDGNTDLQMYEIGKAFRMLLSGNGNLVEMLLSPTVFYDAGETAWRSIAERCLTRRLAAYYRGYYHSQRKRAMENRGGKALLYTYREILSGIRVVSGGSIIYNFQDLLTWFEKTYYPLPLAREHLERGCWREPMSCGKIWEFEQTWSKLAGLLDEAVVISPLPESVDLAEELDDVLWQLRLKDIGFCTPSCRAVERFYEE